jgi:hypothetical protein
MSSANTPVTSGAADPGAGQEERAATLGLCVGPTCNRRWIDGGMGAPTFGDPVLCARCQTTLRTNLEQLDGAAARAAADADGHRSSVASDDSAIRMHRGSVAPRSQSPVFDDLDEMVSCLRGWMARKRPMAARLGYLASEVTEITDWLRFHLPSFSDDREIAADFYQDVAVWHRRLLGLGKAGAALFNKPVPCPRCSLVALQQERGSDHVKCSECSRMMSVREYDDMAAEAESAAAAGAAEAPKARGKRSRPAA